MSSRTARPSPSLPGLLLAVLALFCQVALAGIVLPDEAAAQEQSIAALGVLCQSPLPDAPGGAPHHRHGLDCALCPLCAALAVHAVVPAPAFDMPAPSSQVAERRTLPPPARAPPAQPRATPLPRGPPILI